MSGAGAPEFQISAAGVRVAIIASTWHDEVMSWLVQGAEDAVRDAHGTFTTTRVAGAFELPLAAQAALHSPHVEVAVCLGLIVRGGTPHFEYVCQSVTEGLTRVQLDAGKPIGFGVLTTDTEQQALDRSGRPGAPESKGREAVEAALHSWHALRSIRGEA